VDRRQSTNDREGKHGTELMQRLRDEFLELVRVFIEASKSIYLFNLFFSSSRHPKNFKPAVHGHNCIGSIFIW
jgi:hypothetical protein